MYAYIIYYDICVKVSVSTIGIGANTFLEQYRYRRYFFCQLSVSDNPFLEYR